MITNKSKKFKELKVGDVIYYCARNSFSKESILNGDALQVKSFIINEMKKGSKYTIIYDKFGNNICVKSNVMKEYKTYKLYSTSKEFLKKEIKTCFKYYINSLKRKVKYGKEAEKEINELLNSKIIL